jgi:hypothetical protein
MEEVECHQNFYSIPSLSPLHLWQLIHTLRSQTKQGNNIHQIDDGHMPYDQICTHGAAKINDFGFICQIHYVILL